MQTAERPGNRLSRETAVTLARIIIFYLLSWNSFAQSPPEIVGVSVVADRAQLTWTGNADSYEVQQRTNLTAGSWQPVVTTNGTSASVLLGGDKAFFRLLAVGGGSAFDETRRSQILESVREAVAALPGTDPDADNQKVADFLSKIPELKQVSISADGAVWADFPDGVPLTIINRAPGPGAGGTGQASTSPAQQLGVTAAREAARAETAVQFRSAEDFHGATAAISLGIPESENVYLFSHSLEITNATDELSEWFTDKGYIIVTNSEPTLNALASVKNAGVFYFEGHSTARDVPGGKKKFVLLTADTIENPLPEQFRKEIGYAILGPSQRGRVLYSVTDDFIKNHMTFGSKSFAFVNGCSSFSPDLIVAFRDSVYAGWSLQVLNPDAWRTARFLFDRLLGANKNSDYPEVPAQRPFNLDAIQADMKSRIPRLDESLTHHLELSHLLITTADGNDFGLLAPSIQQMNVDEEKGELHIYGIFDPEVPAEIVVSAGTTVDIKNATPVSKTEIIVPLPVNGPVPAGRVTVIQQGHPSNTLPLTEWRVTGRLVKYFTIDQPQPSSTFEFKLHFRADVHDVRLAPHQAPRFTGAFAKAATDSTFRLVGASGVYHDPDPDVKDPNQKRVVEWKLDQPLDLPIAYQNTAPTRFSGDIRFQMDGSFYLVVSAFARDAMTVTERRLGDEFSYKMDPGTRVFSGTGKNGTFDLKTYTIIGGRGSVAGDSGYVEFDIATPEYPPDPSADGFAE